MDEYYHFTSCYCLPSINFYGLVPQTGFRCKSIDDEKCAVFLSKGMDKAIAMYALMLWRYEHRNEIFNYNKMKSYENTISELSKIVAHGGGSEIVHNYLNSTIVKYNICKQILNYTDFNQYLGGEGVFLSIDGMENKLSENSENCWCEETIPSNNIKIVSIVNKETLCPIYSRELVLAYFMNNVPINEVMKNVSPKYQESVEKMYRRKDELNFNVLNKCNYYLCEIPINLFYYPYYTEKTLTKC